MTEFFFEILGGLMTNIHHLIIFIGCLFYFIKAKNKVSITIFSDSLIVLLTSLSNRLLIDDFILNNDSQIIDIEQFFKLTNWLNLLGSLIFSIGFLMLIRKLIKSDKGLFY